MMESSQPKGKRALLTAAIVTFLGFLGTNLLIPIIALYASELGASPGVIGLIVGFYSMTNTPTNILSGRLIDRRGYRIPLVIGLTIDALSMAGYALSRLPIHLALVRAIHGIGGGLVAPATMSVIAECSGEARKGRAMAFYGMAIAFATLVGFSMSGVLVSRLGYSALFSFGGVMITIGVVISLLLPKTRRRETEAAKPSAGQELDMIKGLLKRKGLVVSYSSIFAQYFAFGGIVTLLPLYARNLGLEAFHVGMLLTVFTVMFIVLQFPSGALSDRVGRLIPIMAGLCLGAVSLVIIPSATEFPLLAMGMALYGIAFALIFPSVSALVADHTIPEERGRAMGLFHALLTAGVAVGAPVTGWAGGVVGIKLALMSSGSILLVALAIALISARRG